MPGYDKVLNITNHQGNANQNHNELSRHMKKTKDISIGEDVDKREPCALVMVMSIGIVIMEKSMDVPQKIKKRTTIWSRNPASGYISKEMKSAS